MKTEITKEILEKARKEAGFTTQAKAAEFLGVSPVTYRRWLCGSRSIPYMALLCLQQQIVIQKLD